MLKHLALSFAFLCLISCGSDDDDSIPPAQQQDPLKQVELLTPEGAVIEASLAYTRQDLTRGLSGVQPEDFDHNDGKFFFYLSEATRTFWMPNTFFDLDIIYLDEDLRIIEIVQDLPHFEATAPSADIPRAPAVRSRHVLEMRADSEISNSLRVGESLEWRSPLTLPQTESRIRQQQ